MAWFGDDPDGVCTGLLECDSLDHGASTPPAGSQFMTGLGSQQGGDGDGAVLRRPGCQPSDGPKTALAPFSTTISPKPITRVRKEATGLPVILRTPVCTLD